MSRHHLFTVFVFVLVLLGLGGTYQFYLKEKLAAYTAAEQEMTKLESRLKTLHSTFKGTDPKVLLESITTAVQPIEQEARQRTGFFHLRDLWEEEKLPEDSGTLPKFEYETRYREKLTSLFQDAGKRPLPVTIPVSIFDQFNVPTPVSLSDESVNKTLVEQWLTQINFGSAITRRLIDANAVYISEVNIWPPRYEFDVLKMRTVGLAFMMRAEDLVKFLQSLQQDTSRYYNVNGLRIQNRDLLSTANGPPFLEVEMLLTVAQFDETKSGTASPLGGLTTASSGSTGMFGTSSSFAFGNSSQSTSKAKKSFWAKLSGLWPF